jgi:hypothetical protein
MQALSSKQPLRPFVAVGKKAQRPSAAAPITAQQPSAPKISRKEFAGLLATVPLLVFPQRALALIPDDDDEELVEAAKARRKTKLATEKVQEQSFARTGGYNNK